MSNATEKPARDLWKQQQTLAALSRQAAAATDPVKQMQDAAALLAETFDSDGSGIVETSLDETELRLQWVPRDSAATVSNDRTAAAATDSVAGFAIAQGNPVVVSDLSAETRFTDSVLRGHGVRSALAVPLIGRDRILGVLLVGSGRANHFAKDDAAYAETIGHLVAGTVARCQVETALAKERTLTQSVLQTVDAIVLLLDRKGRVVRVNEACRRLTGFSSDEVLGRPIWDSLVAPEEAEAFQRLCETPPEDQIPFEFHSHVLTKQSNSCRVAWTCSIVPDKDSAPESILATGIQVVEVAVSGEAGEPAKPSAEEKPVEAFHPLPIPVNAERRRRARRAYPYKQRIGEVIGGVLPKRDEFRAVQCNDIAASGFSFVCSALPQSKTLVVELGTPPKTCYLMAEVAHSTRFEQEGRRVYLIGCRYIGRAVYPEDE